MSREDGNHKKSTLTCSSEMSLEGQENANDISIDSSSLRHVDTIRKSFEPGSPSSLSLFSFGEAFRQRQSQDRIGEKEKIREAREAMHGFRELEMEEKTPGEIDRSPLAKTFTFEGQARGDSRSSQDQPFEGTSFDSRYKASVFVVHHTLGMLLIPQRNDPSLIEIPGGSIEEIELSQAALKSSHYKMQLQLAAREAACRHLYEQTGMDTRLDLERLQPAVLYVEPPPGIDGIRLLRNELNNSLYFLFRVSAEEQVLGPNVDHNGGALADRARRSGAAGPFVFVKEPEKALELLETQGCDSALAFQMIIDESRATSDACLNDSNTPERQKRLVQTHEEMRPTSNDKRRKRKNFSSMKALLSALLCFRKR